MRIVNPKDIFDWKNISKRILPKVFLKKLYKPALIIVGVQIILLPLVLNYNRSTIKYALGINSRYDLLSLYDKQYNYISDFLFYLKDIAAAFLKPNSIERLDLQIDLENISRIKPLLCSKSPITQECQKKSRWAKAYLNYKGDIFKADIRQKGTRKLHHLDLSFNKMSMRINLKGNKRYQGMSSFSIQIPTIRNYDNEIFVSNILKQENILSPRHRYVKFFINGEYAGLRHIEEIVGKDLVESSNKRNGPIFELDKIYGDIFHTSKFQLRQPAEWFKSQPNLIQEGLSILEGAKNNPIIIKKYFNLDKWAVFMATMEAFQTFHGSEPSSVKFYLNPVSGKIEPVFWDGHLDRWHKNTRLSDIPFRYKSESECKIDMLGSSHAVNLCQHQKWFTLFFGTKSRPNIYFFEKYINQLYKYTSSMYIDNQLHATWSSLSPERGNLYREIWRTDEFHRMGLKPYVSSFSTINKRLTRIRNDIIISRTKKPIFSIINDSQFTILNQDSDLPQIISIRCNSNKIGKYLLLKSQRITIDLEKILNCTIDNLEYSIDSDINFDFIDKNYLTSLKLDKIISNSDIKAVNNSKISTFYSNNKYIFEEDIILTSPSLIFEPGAEICLTNGSNIFIKSNKVTFKGSFKDQPVKIIACNEDSGSLIFENTDVSIGNLVVDGLVAPSLPLRTLYSGLNFINSNINIDYLSIYNSYAEDSVNFIDSIVSGGTIKIQDSNSDAIDSDYSTIILDRIICSKILNDCLDLSFSNAIVSSINASDVSDKVISLGESSNLTLKNLFTVRSEMGVVVKDDSKLFLSEYNYKITKLPIVAFIKKQEFDFTYSYINKINPVIKNNYLISNESIVKINNRLLKPNSNSKLIQKALYGNEFGVKTIR